MKRKVIILTLCCSVFLSAILIAQTTIPDLNGQKWAFCGLYNKVDTSGLVGLEHWQGHYLLFDKDNVICTDKNDSLAIRNGVTTEYSGGYALLSDTLSLWFSKTKKRTPSGKIITWGTAVEPDGYTSPFKSKLKIEKIDTTTMTVRVLLSLPIPFWRTDTAGELIFERIAPRQEDILITYYKIN